MGSSKIRKSMRRGNKLKIILIFYFLGHIPASEQLFVCGDWNGHIGSQSTGFEEVHGGQAIGKRNTEGERVLEFAFANKLVVGNTWFKKKPEHLVTYQSGNAATQIDFILYRRSFRKQVSNVKVILGEEIAPQHRLLVGDFRVSIPHQPKLKFVPRIKLRKLRDPEKQAELSEVFKAKTQDSELSQTSSVDVRWTSLKDKLLLLQSRCVVFLRITLGESRPGGGTTRLRKQ